MWPFVICAGMLFPFIEKGNIVVIVTESVKKSYQFRYIYNRGKSYANRYLVMYVIKNGKNGNRLGISVSKKVGKSVTRSRVTRLIRESYRLMESKLVLGMDIVVIARVNAKDAAYLDISKAMNHLLKKHNLLLGTKSNETAKE